MTLGQNHYTHPGHKQSLCEVASDLDPAKLTMGQGHDTPSGHKQCLCEVASDLAQLTMGQGHDTPSSHNVLNFQSRGRTICFQIFFIFLLLTNITK